MRKGEENELLESQWEFAVAYKNLSVWDPAIIGDIKEYKKVLVTMSILNGHSTSMCHGV